MGPLRYLFLPRCDTRDIAELARSCFCSAVAIVRWSPGADWRPPADASAGNSTVYGGLRICRRVAEELGGRLLEPDPGFLVGLPREYVNRRVELTTIGAVRQTHQPVFLKPAVGKAFPAGVYSGGGGPWAYADDYPVLAAEVVAWQIEYRMFVLNRTVVACAPYAPVAGASPEKTAAAAADFCRSALADPGVRLPRAVVLDVGRVQGRGWSVVEANPVNASSIYGCDPAAVLGVLRFGIEVP
jgi:hypothetical protein